VRIRSDFTLRLLLEKIVELGVPERVGFLIQDTLRHMGGRSPYRGGRELTGLLRAAHREAVRHEDERVAERLEDALAYAMNAMLLPDLEGKYQLFEGSRKSNSDLLGVLIGHAAMVRRRGPAVPPLVPGCGPGSDPGFSRQLGRQADPRAVG
jgi:hypothetical protein